MDGWKDGSPHDDDTIAPTPPHPSHTTSALTHSRNIHPPLTIKFFLVHQAELDKSSCGELACDIWLTRFV